MKKQIVCCVIVLAVFFGCIASTEAIFVFSKYENMMKLQSENVLFSSKKLKVEFFSLDFFKPITCDPDFFLCKVTSSCIPDKCVCDKRKNCLDGSDEENCRE